MRASTSPLRRLASVAGLAGVTASVAASLLTAGATPASAATTIANGTFEANVSGWTVPSNVVLERHAPGQQGAYAARVTNKGLKRTVALNDVTNSVSSTKAGTTYDITAYVRTYQPTASVGLRAMEFSGSTLKGQTQASVTLADTKWHKLTVSYKAVTTGASIDVNLLAWSLPTGRSFDVDNVTLAARSLTTQSTTAPAPTPAPEPALSNWKLSWADEFNGTTLDRTKWNAENNSTYGDGNNELACLMDRPENLALGNGTLTIKARKESTPVKCGSSDSRFPGGRSYTSGMLNTKGKFSQNYGRFEVRAKLPTQAGTSKGLWPAFWMRPVSGGTGELDILEAIGSGSTTTEANKVHQTIWYDYTGTHKRQPFTYGFSSGQPSDGFHTYAAEWEPSVIRWYVDGKLTYQRDRSTTSWLDEAFAPGKQFYIRLNMAVGGNWPGSPDANTKFAADYVVDYVRAYKR